MTPHRTGQKKPPWLKRRLPTGPEFEAVRTLVSEQRLHTVCQEAKCPNVWECFSNKTATFLILGPTCTRSCRFCAVSEGTPDPPDAMEPANVARTAKRMQLTYVVVTSVTRDDLPDGGAGLFAETIRAIRKEIPDGSVEVLIPDFQGDPEALRTVTDAQPDVLNHNIETVPGLYETVRPQANYRRSLDLLGQAKMWRPTLKTKSGLMLGLGESHEEIITVMKHLLEVRCTLLTIGQYLQPTPRHLPVQRFVTPEEFDMWRNTALKLGFAQVASGPFIRSSYHAKELFNDATG